MKKKEIPVLNHMLLQLILRRLFLPLLAIWIAAIGGVGYFLLQTLVNQQQETVRSTVKMIDRHLDQGGRILDAVARVAEVNDGEDKAIFMKSTWEAYQHFDTIYYLDENSKITLMVPADPMYLGLDMSNLPDFQNNETKGRMIISRPFISLHTGAPTVYLIRPLLPGGCVVGELSLATFQNEMVRDRDTNEQDSIFILDQSGTLLAHPVAELVKQQTNMSYLEIFNKGLGGDVTLVYEYGGTSFLGSATQVPRVGWVIVDQIPLALLLGPYALTFGITILVMFGIWVTLVWNLRKQLERNVVAPLVMLSRSTDALAIGDYSKMSVLDSVPTTFSELNRLVTDFQRMSINLQVRQTALRASEERYRGLFEKVPTGLFRFNMDGEILDVNRAYILMFGFPDRKTLMEVNGFGLYLSHGDWKQWQAFVEQEEANIFETKMRRYDQSIMWVRIRCRVVRDSDQQTLYYDGSMEDITIEKQAEKVLRDANDQLEIKVERRTQDLVAVNEELQAMNQELEEALDFLQKTQTQLVQSEKMASLGSLVAGIAHEINTPLGVGVTAISHLKQITQDFAKLYKSDNLKRYDVVDYIADTNEAVAIISSNLERAAQLVRSFKQVSVDQSSEARRVFNVKHYINEILLSLHPILKKTKLLVKVHCADELELDGFPGALAQIGTNLIMNSLIHAYEPTSEGTITIDIKRNGEEEICLIYSDDGKGMDEMVSAKIFDPFFTTKRGSGSGLGMYILYNIVTQQLGGTITCASQPGRGVTFTICWPV